MENYNPKGFKLTPYLRDDYVAKWEYKELLTFWAGLKGNGKVPDLSLGEYRSFDFNFPEAGNDRARIKYYNIPTLLRERWQGLIEARTMINFDHPNICRVRDVFKLKTQKVMGVIEEVYDEGTLL